MRILESELENGVEKKLPKSPDWGRESPLTDGGTHECSQKSPQASQKAEIKSSILQTFEKWSIAKLFLSRCWRAFSPLKLSSKHLSEWFGGILGSFQRAGRHLGPTHIPEKAGAKWKKKDRHRPAKIWQWSKAVEEWLKRGLRGLQIEAERALWQMVGPMNVPKRVPKLPRKLKSSPAYFKDSKNDPLRNFFSRDVEELFPH